MRRLFTLTVLLVATLASQAQWQIGIGGMGLGPVDRFDSSVYKPGGGMFFNLHSSSILPKNQPFEIRFGMYFDFLQSGSKSFDVDLTDPINEEGEVRFVNRSTGHHFTTRIGYKANDRLTFFSDVIIGHRKFVSETTTGVKGYSEEYKDDVQTIHKDRTFRYGVGMGSRISVERSFGIEVRADYTRGNQASYFNLDQTVETATAIEYESQTWPHTDLFVYGVALNWKLFRPQPSSNDVTRPPTRTHTPPSNNPYNYNNRRTTSPSRRTTTTTPTQKKKKVTPSKGVKKKEEEEKINW